MIRSTARHLSSRYVLLLIAVSAAFAVMIWPTLTVSFWLDDSWTANSVREPDLRGMLRYTGWMQHTPPLFLFVLRWGVAWADSEWVWRLIPGLGTLAAAVLFWRFLRREFQPLAAIAGLILLLFNDSLGEQATAIRSYSWETALAVGLLAASVQAFRERTVSSLVRLYGLACILVVSGYSAPIQIAAASVLPLWAWWLTRRRTGASRFLAYLAGGVALSGALFAAVYFTMLTPNIEPALSSYWFTGPRATLTATLISIVSLLPGSRMLTDAPLPGLAVMIVCLPPLLVAFRRAGAREWMRNAPAVAGWAMILFAALGHITHLIPLSPRGGVYLVPWGIAAVMGTIRMGCRLGRSSLSETGWRRAAVALIAILMLGAVHSTVRALYVGGVVREDFRAIVRDLGSGLGPGDRLIIHSTTREQFKYYSRMAGFSPGNIVWSDTAWPCCVRGKPPFQLGSPEALEREAFPPGSSAPARILFTALSYPWHWKDCGGDERPVWRTVFEKRGCRLAGRRTYGAADLLTFNCGGG